MGTVHAKVNSIIALTAVFLCLFDHDLPVQSGLTAPDSPAFVLDVPVHTVIDRRILKRPDGCT